MVEVKEKERDADNHPIFDERPVQGEDVIGLQKVPWTGEYDKDNAAEAKLLIDFFNALVEGVRKVAGADQRAPLHFYVWSRGEISQVVEAFTRTGLSLHAFNQLLGCREGPEQMIFSCMHAEVDRRYGFGWTGRGLVVASSLTWFGKRYHWLRDVNGTSIDLSWAFRQDVFDFRRTLYYDAAGQWSEKDSAPGHHTFEIRSRFGDTLPAPYWRAYWGTLHFPPGVDARIREQINRYHEGGRVGILESYLVARSQALRWIDERVRFKNREIEKPSFDLADLPTFTLGVDNVGQASVDFLRLDHRVGLNDWIAEHLMPPAFRVLGGRTIPIGSITYPERNLIRAQIHLAECEVDLAGLKNRCDLKEGDFVRVSRCDDSGDLSEGQSIGQLTRAGHNGAIDRIDWDAGTIDIRVIVTGRGGGGFYVLNSHSAPPSDDAYRIAYATVDESASDFVAGRVEARLLSGQGAHAHTWFDPRIPSIPDQVAPPAADLAAFEKILFELRIKRLSGVENPLNPEQQAVALDGLSSKVQLLQGPPGTGKTQTTAAAVLLRILARRRAGVPKRGKTPAVAGDIVLLAAHTHNAVDELLTRLCIVRESLSPTVTAAGSAFPFTVLAKVFSTAEQIKPLTDCVDEDTGQMRRLPVEALAADSCAAKIKDYRKNAVLVIGGTTSALLKMAEKLDGTAAFPSGLSVPMLIVDEASMLVFPHFLALASLVDPGGEMLLAGDHRQLAPIVAHDWETEDRPTVETFKPHLSAYEALDGIKTNGKVSDAAIYRRALEYTFRLPEIIRRLITPTYLRDGIKLKGRDDVPESPDYAAEPNPWARVWLRKNGLFIVTHNERQSRRSNEVELDAVEKILRADPSKKKSSVAVISPHRAQRGALQQRLADLTGKNQPIKVIDTVEKLQGGEASTIIVSATASDPSAIGRNVDFILSLTSSKRNSRLIEDGKLENPLVLADNRGASQPSLIRPRRFSSERQCPPTTRKPQAENPPQDQESARRRTA